MNSFGYLIILDILEYSNNVEISTYQPSLFSYLFMSVISFLSAL